jgi:homospermidine synthase
MKVILIGCGGVGCAILELLPICRLLPPGFGSPLVVIEPRAIARLPVLKPYKYKHIRVALTPGNIGTVLDPVLEKGAVVLDCSVNVDALAVMDRCHRRGCLYVNCSMEDWETPDAGRVDPRPAALLKRSLCTRVWRGRERWGGRGPTMLADEGMNPGIVSLYALQGLEDMARTAGDDAAVRAMRAGQYARAAELLGIRAVHITERDTQTLKRARPKGHFWNSWSAVGLIAEALDPVQMGRGTHEGAAPRGAVDERNMRIVPERGMDVKVWSWSPSRRGAGGNFGGMLIPHGEANTLSTALSGPAYRPSVYFVYQPSPFARASLAEMRRGGYHPPPDRNTRVVTLPEIKAGYDAVGALLWSDKHPPWWSGCVLDRSDMAPLGVTYSGPTTIQVAIAVLSAMKWMIAHPDRGFITPEDLPYAQILRDCAPYLGRVYSGPAGTRARPAPYRLGDFLGAAPRRRKKAAARRKPPAKPAKKRRAPATGGEPRPRTTRRTTATAAAAAGRKRTATRRKRTVTRRKPAPRRAAT